MATDAARFLPLQRTHVRPSPPNSTDASPSTKLTDDAPNSRNLWGVGGVILHELSHSFHDKFVLDGFRNAKWSVCTAVLATNPPPAPHPYPHA